jgi:hypothetical protein
MEKIKKPWLIQRCKCNKNFTQDILTGKYLKLDYMGSAEFEFGAVPEFQREVNKKLASLTINNIIHNGIELWYTSPVNEIEEYAAILKDLIEDKITLKECSGIDPKSYYGKNTNTWLDLTNNLFFARDKKTVENLFITIQNSVKYMDSQE